MKGQKKKHVELAKLRLGMDSQGRVHVGEADKEGKLKPNTMKNVNGDYQRIMQIQLKLAMGKIESGINQVRSNPKLELVIDEQIKEIPKAKKKEKNQ